MSEVISPKNGEAWATHDASPFFAFARCVLNPRAANLFSGEALLRHELMGIGEHERFYLARREKGGQPKAPLAVS